MTQGYGNHESATDTKAAKKGAPEKPEAPKPDTGHSTGRADHKDVATPGDGAGPDETTGRDVDPGVG